MTSKRIRFRMVPIVFLILFMLIMISACSNQKEKPTPPKPKEEVKTIESIEEKVEDVIKKIEGIQKEMKKPIEMEEDKKEEEGKQQQGQANQDSQQGGQGEGTQESQQQQKEKKQQEKEKKLYEEWQKVKKSTEDIHTTWNDFETKAGGDGVEEKYINGFEEALNNLTMTVEEQEDKLSLVHTNKMILYLGDFIEFYEGKGKDDLMRIKYYIRQTHLDGMMKNWGGAKEEIQKAIPLSSKLKQVLELEKKDEELVSKLRASLEDMDMVLKNENEELLMVKRDIALKNLEGIKEAAK